MNERTSRMSPRLKARLAGVFYIFTAGAPINLYIGQRLIVPGDAAATANNILASEPLYRAGIAAEFITGATYTVVGILLYDLFMPVNRNLSLLAAFYCLAGVIVMTLSCLFRFIPLITLDSEQYLNAFGVEISQALGLMFLKLHGLGSTLSLVFFGLYMSLIGYLIIRSIFIPRIVGVLTMIAGLGYLTHSFAFFLSPPLPSSLASYAMIFALGELALFLWLLLVGVNTSKWHEQASAASVETRGM